MPVSEFRLSVVAMSRFTASLRLLFQKRNFFRKFILVHDCRSMRVTQPSVFLRRSFSAALEGRCAPLPSLRHWTGICDRATPPLEDRICDNRFAPNLGCKEDVEVRSPVALSLLSLLLYEDVHCYDVRLFLDSIPL